MGTLEDSYRFAGKKGRTEQLRSHFEAVAYEFVKMF